MSESGATGIRSGDSEGSALKRGVALLQIALFGGIAVLAAVLFALFVVASIREGEYDRLALPALLILIGGPFSLLYLLPVLTDGDARRELAEGLPQYGRPSGGEIAIAALLGAALILGAVSLGPSALGATLAFAFVATVAASAVDEDWSFNPTEETITYNGMEGDLSTVTDSRRIDVAGRAVLWLTYAGPNELGRPRLLVLPSGAADDVLDVVPEVLPESEGARSRSETIAIGGMALVFLGLAATLVAVGQGTEDAVALYMLAAMPGFFGLMLLYLAA